MKKLFLIICLGFYALHSQNVVFTDAKFKGILLNNDVNVNKDGEISFAEALTADTLDINVYFSVQDTIQSYDDLASFPNLTFLKIYDASYSSQNKTIDFSKLVKLKGLNLYARRMVCKNLSALTELESIELNLGIDDIDLHDLSKLEDVRLSYFSGQLKLPVGLKNFRISMSDITELDLSACMAPNSSVYIGDCRFLDSINLPVSKLISLYLDDLDALTSLDLSQCMLPLNTVSILGCPKLKSLKLSDSTQLQDLTLKYNGLANIDLESQTMLKKLSVEGNGSLSLKLPKTNVLQSLWLISSYSFPIVDLRHCSNLETLYLSCYALDSLFLPISTRLKALHIEGIYIGTKSIVNLEVQTKLVNLNFNATCLNSIIDISQMDDLKLFGFGGYRNTQNEIQYVCIRDTNQLENIDLSQVDPYTHFITCHKIVEPTCVEHITPTTICEDFKDASSGDESNDEYSILTEYQAWLYDAPNPYQKAYKGIYWVLPGQSDEFTSSKTRNTDGSLTFQITKTGTLVQPMMLSFGNYADGSNEGKFTVDLSNNAIVSFEIKDLNNFESNLIVELEDIHSHTLMLDKTALQNYHEDFYERYQIGVPIRLVDERDNKVNGVQLNHSVHTNIRWDIMAKYLPDFAPSSNEVYKFYYDFKNAICGNFEKVPVKDSWSGDSVVKLVPKTDIQFDYKNVSLVKLLRTTNGEVLPEGTDYGFTISNFRMGGVPQTVGVEDMALRNASSEVFKVYDMMGTFVTEGTWEQLKLGTQQLYIMKSKERTFKIVVNE